MLNLNANLGTRPFKFEYVRDELLKNIENGQFQNNVQLPSITEVCGHYNLSRVTVGRAYLHLKMRGYISYIAGKGFFIQPKTSIGNCKIDICTALESLSDLFTKYNHLKLMLPPGSMHPIEFIIGLRRFCQSYKKGFTIMKVFRYNA